MKFCANIRSMHAAVVLAVSAFGLAVPTISYGQTPIQTAPSVQQPANPTVQTSEPVVNDPVIPTPPPVIIPNTVPTQVPTPIPAPKAAKKKDPVDSLRPGQFVWVKQDIYEGPMKIVAVLDIQRIYVFQNDKLLGFSTISSGKKGKETPVGIFNILQKNIDHKSNLYSNAPMPFMQRLTWDGIAMHGGHLPGYPASHGCIRLPHAFAKSLFGATQMGQEVVVLKNTSTPVKRPEPVPVPVPVPVPSVITPPAVELPQPPLTLPPGSNAA